MSERTAGSARDMRIPQSRTGLQLHSPGRIVGNRSFEAGKCSDRPGRRVVAWGRLAECGSVWWPCADAWRVAGCGRTGLRLHSSGGIVGNQSFEAEKCSDRPGCGLRSARRVQCGGRALRPGHGRSAGSPSRGAARRTGLRLHSSGGILGNQSLGAGKCSDRPGLVPLPSRSPEARGRAPGMGLVSGPIGRAHEPDPPGRGARAQDGGWRHEGYHDGRMRRSGQ